MIPSELTQSILKLRRVVGAKEFDFTILELFEIIETLLGMMKEMRNGLNEIALEGMNDGIAQEYLSLTAPLESLWKE